MRTVIKFVLGAVLSAAFVGATGFVLMAPGFRIALQGAGHGNRAARRFRPISILPRRPARATRAHRSRSSARGDSKPAGTGRRALFTGPIQDRGSIEEVRNAFATRARRGIADRRSELDTIRRGAPDPSFRALRTQASIVYLLMYEGRFAEAAEWTEQCLDGEPIGAARAAGQPGGAAGGHPPAAGGDGELPGLPRPLELHLADRARGRAPAAVGVARGHPPFHVHTCASGRRTSAFAGC